MRIILLCLLLMPALSFAKNTDKQTSVADFTENMSQQTGFFDFYYQIEHDKVFLKIDKFDQPFLFKAPCPKALARMI
jgi:hypothetical protein